MHPFGFFVASIPYSYYITPDVLLFEPENPEAQKFQSLLDEKITLEAELEEESDSEASSDDEEYEDGDDEEDSEDDDSADDSDFSGESSAEEEEEEEEDEVAGESKPDSGIASATELV